MAWVIVVFTDQTVSCIPKKWLKAGNVRNCYYPKTGAAAKIKAAVDVDIKSGKWSLIPYRLLMHGEEFATYFLARKAEKVAQNHSTMSSFERSFSAKQNLRKHPIVHFNSSSDGSESSEGESQDFKNIRKLSKLDAGLMVDDKDYHYNSRKKNDNGSSGKLLSNEDQLLASDHNQSSDQDENESSNIDTEILRVDREISNIAERKVDDYSSADEVEDESADEVEDESADEVEYESADDVDDASADENSSSDDNFLIEESGNNRKNRSKEKDSIFSQIQRDYTDNFQLESSNREQSLVNIGSPQLPGYKDFSDARRLPFIEKGVFCACQQLEENKAVLKEINETVNETKALVQSFVPIIKDLTVEVFDSKEELFFFFLDLSVCGADA